MRVHKAVGLIVACVLISTVASAMASHWAFALFSKLPPIPKNAQDAYAQWIDHPDQALEPGTALKRFETAFKGAMTAGGPSQSQIQQAAAMAKQAEAGGGMSPAQAMALAKQMQATMGMQTGQYTGPVSDHDGRLLDGIAPYPQMGDLGQRLGALNTQWLDLMGHWEGEIEAINKKQTDDLERISSCNDEAGSPNDVAIRAVLYRYEGQKLALATSYIGKLTPLIVQYGIDVKPEVSYADTAYSKWSQIRNPGLKTSVKPSIDGVMRKAFTDIGSVAGMTKQLSEKAANTVAEHKATERRYKNAAACP